MATTMTSKGQVTIPKRVRDALGLKPGSKVEIGVEMPGAAMLRLTGKPRKSGYRKRLESVSGIIDLGGMTTDEYMKFLRGDRD